uniref:HTH psq-type domain-containing protein n=1 Tax=Gouania willdenowi TaxID=441366 RepID=A0A8C5IAT8_GOUWI
MPRTYKRKTGWDSTSLEEMERASNDVKGGKSIKTLAKERNIDRSTLRRYFKKREAQEVETIGYSVTAKAKRVFSKNVEKDLADHIKKLAEQFHSLTPKKCHELALEKTLAEINNIPTPRNWRKNALAGKQTSLPCLSSQGLDTKTTSLQDSRVLKYLVPQLLHSNRSDTL